MTQRNWIDDVVTEKRHNSPYSMPDIEDLKSNDIRSLLLRLFVIIGMLKKLSIYKKRNRLFQVRR